MTIAGAYLCFYVCDALLGVSAVLAIVCVGTELLDTNHNGPTSPPCQSGVTIAGAYLLLRLLLLVSLLLLLLLLLFLLLSQFQFFRPGKDGAARNIP